MALKRRLMRILYSYLTVTVIIRTEYTIYFSNTIDNADQSYDSMAPNVLVLIEVM